MRDEKFKELAERRVNNAIKQIRLVANLANPNAYEYTDEQVRKICVTLKGELAKLQAKFKAASGGTSNNEFSL